MCAIAKGGDQAETNADAVLALLRKEEYTTSTFWAASGSSCNSELTCGS